MYIEEKKLKDFIADSGLVSMSDIDVAEGESFRKGSSVGDVLVEMGKITSDDLLRMEAYVLGIPFVDLQGKSIDFSVLSMIPEPIARKHNVIAFSNSDNGLEVAIRRKVVPRRWCSGLRYMKPASERSTWPGAMREDSATAARALAMSPRPT